MSLSKIYTTEVSLATDANSDIVITSISGSSTQLTATSFLSGPPGTPGSTGAKGDTGPNLVDTTTATTLAAILKGNGTHVAAAVVDTDYQRPLTVTNIGSSGNASLTAGVLNIPNYAAASAVLTTKGDIYGFSSVNARVPIGSDGQVLTADSTLPLGLKWAPSSGSSDMVYDVKAVYGAAGNGTTDDTTAIQNAINAAHAAGGGIVWFPAGTYKITATLTVYQHIQLWGAGDGPLDGTGGGSGTAVTTIKQVTTTANGITGTDVYDLAIRDMAITGPNSGSGVGISLTRSTSGDCRYLHFSDLTVQQFGSHGISIDLPIVSTFQGVVTYQNGANGFNIIATGGAASTSCNFIACWASNNTGIGWNINTMVYSTFTSCAADTNGTQGYLFTACQGVSLSSCGAEANTGNSFKFTGCYNITATAIWTFHNSTIGWYVTGSSVDVTLIGFHENTPSGSPTASIKVDTGCVATLSGYYVITAVSLATGTTNVLNDGAGAMTVQGQLNLPNSAHIEFGSDSNLYRLGANSIATDGTFTAFTKLIGSAFQLTASTTSGYVLTTDASGNGTWQPAAGGGVSLTVANTWTGAQTFNLGKLLDKGEIVFDVKAYGAVGNGTTDDTAAIQAAVDAAHTAGGGVVWFPAGTYKLVTNPIKLYSGTTPTITGYTNITLRGAGSDGATGVIINQTTTGVDVIKALNDAANGAQAIGITIENLCVGWGTGTLTNSGNGIYFAQQAANGPAFLQCAFKNVRAQNLQGTNKYGFNIESMIISSFEDCHSVLNAGGYFFNGAVGSEYGSVSTSVTAINCYANACVSYGWRFINCTYMSLQSCACDISSNVSTSAYSFEGCNAISLIACGFELDGTQTLANGYHIAADASTTGSSQISLYNCYGFQSKSTVEVYVTGVSTGVTIIGYQSNSSISGSTGLKVDAGSTVFETFCAWDTGPATPRNINATGIDMIMGDSDGYGVSAIPTSLSIGGGTALTTTNRTGTGNLVLATSPTLVTPVLGVATATSINKVTITAPATSATLTIANGKTLTYNNSVTIAGTDSTTMTFPSTSGNVIASATGIGTVSGTPSSANFLRGDGTWAAAGGGSGSTTPTASTISEWDANVNMSANNFIDGFTTTATAAGTTTLTITSTGIQVFTGSTTQTVKLPTTSVAAGGQYQIVNNSTGAVTVQSSGANTITILAAGTSAIFTAVVVTPTTAANWNAQYIGIVSASGKKLTVSNTLTLAGTDSTTMTFPSTSATIARTDAAQTFTGVQTFGSAPVVGSFTNTGTITLPTTTSTLAGLAIAQTFTATQTASLWNTTPQAATVTTNAATLDITHGIQNFTNSSAAAMTITCTTTSAVDGQFKVVRIYDFSAVAEAITWVNTENSTVSVPGTSNGSTTLPLTTILQYNGSTSKWRCVGVI